MYVTKHANTPTSFLYLSNISLCSFLVSTSGSKTAVTNTIHTAVSLRYVTCEQKHILTDYPVHFITQFKMSIKFCTAIIYSPNTTHRVQLYNCNLHNKRRYVCLSVADARSNGWADQDQTWHRDSCWACTAINLRPEDGYLQLVTVQHGSADTVVRAMNDFNGKCYFSGSDSSETLWLILKKFGTVDYVGDPTPHANVGLSRFKRGVSAHAWSCRRQASIFFTFFKSHAHRYRSARWTDQRR